MEYLYLVLYAYVFTFGNQSWCLLEVCINGHKLSIVLTKFTLRLYLLEFLEIWILLVLFVALVGLGYAFVCYALSGCGFDCSYLQLVVFV